MIADEIKAAVSMLDVARFYGYEPNWHNYIKCPFHGNGNEKTASMQLKPKYFKCYGCGKFGTVIDFAMELFGLTFDDACIRLNEDFGLGLTNDKPDPEVLVQRRRERQETERKRSEYEAEYMRRTDEYRRLHRAYMDKAPGLDDVEWDDEFCEALRRLPELDEWFEKNEFVR